MGSRHSAPWGYIRAAADLLRDFVAPVHDRPPFPRFIVAVRILFPLRFFSLRTGRKYTFRI